MYTDQSFTEAAYPSLSRYFKDFNSIAVFSLMYVAAQKLHKRVYLEKASLLFLNLIISYYSFLVSSANYICKIGAKKEGLALSLQYDL